MKWVAYVYLYRRRPVKGQSEDWRRVEDDNGAMMPGALWELEAGVSGFGWKVIHGWIR